MKSKHEHEDLVWLVEVRGQLKSIETWAEADGDSTLVQILGPPLGHIEQRIADFVTSDAARAVRARSAK